jgi:hypothetical protein
VSTEVPRSARQLSTRSTSRMTVGFRTLFLPQRRLFAARRRSSRRLPRRRPASCDCQQQRRARDRGIPRSPRPPTPVRHRPRPRPARADEAAPPTPCSVPSTSSTDRARNASSSVTPYRHRGQPRHRSALHRLGQDPRPATNCTSPVPMPLPTQTTRWPSASATARQRARRPWRYPAAHACQTR